ncbi:hypothetical protein Back11_45470 [Paenibacillus baekrokdamisoli]|uniref:Uncharacterized protein n=1 Tax=Paenibacillus baekrokdamisoli TaxID=1712516 RepID=A0A3G9IXZ2_9BACL|nr:prolyl oligopeptidase family serine peptidase [Paenibacillus baekrokdamisoli]MBB3072332.1 cephalosporin-C deacetylase-like acetyl esterase [Paenibacillus baekrokdamisoli]BBH23202.1 hypothetical protein Back11_45470 [Paenibacillus baekrokdamisoli]
MNRIITEQFVVQGIPILSIYEESASRLPLVIYIHGYGGSKKDGLEFGHKIVERGMYFVAFDAAGHGERKQDERDSLIKESSVYPPDTGLDTWLHMLEVIAKTTEDIDALLLHFMNDPKVNTERLGVTGLSMGGYAVYFIAANDPRVQVAVPIIGLASFLERWEDVLLESSTYERWAEALKESEEHTKLRTAFVQSIDPYDKLASFYPKPLLISIGDIDVEQPKKYTINLYKTLKPAYRDCPDRLKLSVHDGVGHFVTSAMMEEACEWFEKHL